MELYAHLLWIVALLLCGYLIFVFMNPAWLSRHRREDTYLVAIQSLLAGHAEQIDRLMQAQEHQTAEIASMVAHMSDAVAKQSESFTAYLDSFRVTGTPQVHTRTDDDEYQFWLTRAGYPVDQPPADQAAVMEALLKETSW